MEVSQEKIIKIQRWWRKYNLDFLRDIKKCLDNLTPNNLQEISNKCHAIQTACRGDGNGLLSGGLIDMVLSDFFEENIPGYEKNHCGESDMKIKGTPLSLKKISGKSTCALNWSKNGCNYTKENFVVPICIINLKSQRWWKTKPTNGISKVKYNDIIPRGIFLIDNQFCKHRVKLAKNNKTNTLIESQYLYIMLKRSIGLKCFIELPPPKDITFKILNAFSE